MTDRNELRRLAEDANERGGWYPAGVMWDVLIEALRSQTAKEDAAYIAAAPPEVVLGLLDEIEGLSLAAKVAEDHAHKRAEERDQLRAVALRLKGALEEILKGGIHDVQFFARDSLSDPEVEKL